MDELKPCPFCGGKPTLMFNSVVECRHCPNGKYSGYPSAGITAWNTRAASGGLNEPFGKPKQLASLEQRAQVLEEQVSAMKAAATDAHRICYEAMVRHPTVTELGDDGELHRAIHAILAVDTPTATAALANQQGGGEGCSAVSVAA